MRLNLYRGNTLIRNMFKTEICISPILLNEILEIIFKLFDLNFDLNIWRRGLNSCGMSVGNAGLLCLSINVVGYIWITKIKVHKESFRIECKLMVYISQ